MVRDADERERDDEQRDGERQVADEALLALAVRVHEVDEPEARDLEHVEGTDDEEDDGEAHDGVGAGLSAEHEAEARDVGVEQARRGVEQRLRQQDAHGEADDERTRADGERLHGDDARDVAAVHAEREVDGELALASADEEAVAEQDEKREEHGHEDGYAPDDRAELLHEGAHVARKLEHRALLRDGVERVVHGDAEHEREEVDAEVPNGATDVAEGDPSVHLPPPHP